MAFEQNKMHIFTIGAIFWIDFLYPNIYNAEDISFGSKNPPCITSHIVATPVCRVH